MDTKKIFTCETKGLVDTENRKLVGVIGSTGAIDRHGESVNPMGWKLENYMKNPVILYGHDYHTLPVGKAERVYLEDNSLKFDIKFAETDFATDVFKLFADKILNAFSVGFIPKKWGVSGQDEYDIMEQELLELSVVTVPANPEALALIKSMEVKYEIKEELPAEEPIEVVEENKPELQEEPAEVVEETPTEPEQSEESVEEVAEVEEEEKAVEKSPECRISGESKKECVARKIPEIMNADPNMSQDQAIAIAFSMCSKRCDTGEVISDEQDEADEKNAKTIALLKEVTTLFRKADQANEKGLSILRQLKSALLK